MRRTSAYGQYSKLGAKMDMIIDIFHICGVTFVYNIENINKFLQLFAKIVALL